MNLSNKSYAFDDLHMNVFAFAWNLGTLQNLRWNLAGKYSMYKDISWHEFSMWTMKQTSKYRSFD